MNLVLGEKKNFGFQNLERGKPFLNIEVNEFNSMKVKKILQISRTLRINIQLFSLNEFNKNVFKLTIVNLHLIVNISFAFILF